jgi:hypothetical protein
MGLVGSFHGAYRSVACRPMLMMGCIYKKNATLQDSITFACKCGFGLSGLEKR